MNILGEQDKTLKLGAEEVQEGGGCELEPCLGDVAWDSGSTSACFWVAKGTLPQILFPEHLSSPRTGIFGLGPCMVVMRQVQGCLEMRKVEICLDESLILDCGPRPGITDCWDSKPTIMLHAVKDQEVGSSEQKEDEALPLRLLLCWIGGDLTNFIGCYLTNQLPIQLNIFAALCYMNMSMIMPSQFANYKLKNQKKKKINLHYTDEQTEAWINGTKATQLADITVVLTESFRLQLSAFVFQAHTLLSLIALA
ncbi:PREDICTED: uncharacterized protein LOC103084749 [Lipotes vexillifer]|uniref:Uncharacterized protein LOC103084749 n=1 Tax=Lipotes vexillifer TaxID=118797 RepID=A0A340WLC9_LIPVE|nr:PREDICTED: uncharacterized protein LOC103084749 [Lipotes vexillifer]